jgi:hypothetical protein
MTDAEIRLANLKHIIVEDASRSFMQMRQKTYSECKVDFVMSEKLYQFHMWLVNKHDSIYNVKFGNLGLGRGMVGRTVKEGHTADEFNDNVWRVIDDWARLYSRRRMNEELYVAINNDSPEELYSRALRWSVQNE